jgi:hypothetical protein
MRLAAHYLFSGNDIALRKGFVDIEDGLIRRIGSYAANIEESAKMIFFNGIIIPNPLILSSSGKEMLADTRITIGTQMPALYDSEHRFSEPDFPKCSGVNMDSIIYDWIALEKYFNLYSFHQIIAWYTTNIHIEHGIATGFNANLIGIDAFDYVNLRPTVKSKLIKLPLLNA